METSVAVEFSNLYIRWNEKETLLPKYCDNLKWILFCTRFVDDIFFIWISDADTLWEELIQD
jgi:hypothetical protein